MEKAIVFIQEHTLSNVIEVNYLNKRAYFMKDFTEMLLSYQIPLTFVLICLEAAYSYKNVLKRRRRMFRTTKSSFWDKS